MTQAILADIAYAILIAGLIILLLTLYSRWEKFFERRHEQRMEALLRQKSHRRNPQ